MCTSMYLYIHISYVCMRLLNGRNANSGVGVLSLLVSLVTDLIGNRKIIFNYSTTSILVIDANKFLITIEINFLFLSLYVLYFFFFFLEIW